MERPLAARRSVPLAVTFRVGIAYWQLAPVGLSDVSVMRESAGSL